MVIRWHTVSALVVAALVGGVLWGASAGATAAPEIVPAAARIAAAAPSPLAVAPVQVSTTARIAPPMPTTVFVNYSDDSTRSTAVTWADIEPLRYAEPGSFVVEGAVEGVPVRATATVTVTQAEQVRAPALNLTVGSVEAGREIAVDGANFATPIDGEGRGGPVSVWLYPEAVRLGAADVAADRTLRLTVVIPPGTVAGEHRIRAVQDGVDIVSAPFTVTAAPDPAEPPAPVDPAAPIVPGGSGGTPPGAGSNDGLNVPELPETGVDVAVPTIAGALLLTGAVILRSGRSRVRATTAHDASRRS